MIVGIAQWCDRIVVDLHSRRLIISIIRRTAALGVATYASIHPARAHHYNNTADCCTRSPLAARLIPLPAPTQVLFEPFRGKFEIQFTFNLY